MIKPLLEKIIKPGVSDLHLKTGEPPLIRMHGQLVPIGTNLLKGDDIEAIINAFLSDDQKKNLHGKGDIDFSYPMDNLGRLRVNIYKQRGNYALAIRIIPPQCKSFEELYLPKDTLSNVCRFTRGLILISGVTGAGKTTTLNAMIHHMNENFFYNIITLEDPIEFSHERKKSSISQREITKDVGSFREGLNTILRQDPDVIVIGEMRSAETFSAAIEAAASGHLVLGTLHSSDTVDAVDRIVNAFPFQEQPYVRHQLTSVLTAIISQRLVPEKNGRGRFPATEILLGSSQMKKLLLANSGAEVKFLMEKGSAFGMHAFDQDILRLFEEGHVSADAALNYASNPNDLRLKMQGLPGSPGLESIK